jgi:hypothetical protein
MSINNNLLKACKAQHQAIDLLFARLTQLDRNFFPSKSGLPWELANQGLAAIKRAEATPPVGNPLILKLAGVKVNSFPAMVSAQVIKLEISAGGVIPHATPQEMPVIAWTFKATGWLSWQVIKWLSRHIKTQCVTGIHGQERKFIVYPLPSDAEQMARRRPERGGG